MKKQYLAAAFAAFTALAAPAYADFGSTLAGVKEAGALKCTSHNGSYLGFAEVDDNGEWRGLDIDLCRGLATAIFGDDEGHLELIPLSWAQRFPSIQAGEVDIIIKATGWTMGRDTEIGLQYSVPYFIGTNNVMVHKGLGIDSAAQLDGGSVCIPAGTTLERHWASFAAKEGIEVEVLAFEKTEELRAAYYSQRCDGFVQGGPTLAIARSAADDPSAHVIMPENLTLEPLAMAMRQGDDQWVDLANWLIFTLIYAEQEGVTMANVADMKANPPSAEIGKMLGATPGYGERFGLSDDWAFNVISKIGNYEEIWDRNLGEDTAYKLPRGINALWNEGGALYPMLID